MGVPSGLDSFSSYCLTYDCIRSKFYLSLFITEDFGFKDK